MADRQTPDNKDLNKINIEQYMRRGLKNQSKKEDSEGEKEEPFNYTQSEMEEKSFEEQHDVKKLKCYTIGDVSLKRKENSSRENLKLSHYLLKKDFKNMNKENTNVCMNPCCIKKIKDPSKCLLI
jgi:hypothetical protein